MSCSRSQCVTCDRTMIRALLVVTQQTTLLISSDNTAISLAASNDVNNIDVSSQYPGKLRHRS